MASGNPDSRVEHTITAHTLRDVLMCERRVWLDAHGDSTLPEMPPETLRLFALGTQHEQRIQQSMAVTIDPVPVTSWREAVAVTRDLMARGVDGIVGACLEARTPLDLTDRVFTVRGQVDRLVRVSQGDEPVYAPVEIKQRAQPDDADWVQLDFYVWLLSLVQGTAPSGELWLGENAFGLPRARLEHQYDEDRLMAALLRAIAVLDAVSEPGVRIEPHCKTCRWNILCQSLARVDGNIDLLYALPRTTRANMRRAGIATLSQVLAASPEALQQVKGIGAKTAVTIRANARAWVENQPVWRAPLPAISRAPGWMFDLETHEVKGKTVPWCMGWCDSGGRTHIALVNAVQLPQTLTLPGGEQVTYAPDSDSAWEVFAESVAADDGPIYHWTGYDAALLRGSAPAHVVERLLPRFHDLHATFKQSVSLPLKSTSIKPVSVYFGFEWPGHQDYRAAYVDYRYWLDDGDGDALTRAVTYQRADVQSMAVVWRWLVTHTP